MTCQTEVQDKYRILPWVAQNTLCQKTTTGLEIAWALAIQQRSEFKQWLVYAATQITDEYPKDFRKIIKMLQEHRPGQTAAKLIFFFFSDLGTGNLKLFLRFCSGCIRLLKLYQKVLILKVQLNSSKHFSAGPETWLNLNIAFSETQRTTFTWLNKTAEVISHGFPSQWRAKQYGQWNLGWDSLHPTVV